MTASNIKDLNKYIDHTVLKADTTAKDIEKLCQEAIQYQFKSVCIQPGFITKAKALLDGKGVEICTVIGFPLGANTTEVKTFEAKDALEKGATEVDMVINVSALKDKNYDYLKHEIGIIRDITQGYVLKVIIETSLLDVDEIRVISQICSDLKVDFVKTSTGFSTYGARLEDVLVIKEAITPGIQIKASGGIKTYEDVMAYLDAGVTRIGTSSGIQLMQGEDSNSAY